MKTLQISTLVLSLGLAGLAMAQANAPQDAT